MAFTLSDIQARISTMVDQSVTPPNTGTSEWNIRATFINRAIEEWGNAYNWDSLKKTAFLSVVSVGGPMSMPTDFKKLTGFPKLFGETNDPFGEPWPEIQSNEKYMKAGEDHFFYLSGDRGNGFSVNWNPTLASGASVYIEYYAFPRGASLSTDTFEIPDPEFLVDRAMAYILQSRNDSRFQQFEAQAREKLLLMVDNENEKSRAYRNKIDTPENFIYGFRLGRD